MDSPCLCATCVKGKHDTVLAPDSADKSGFILGLRRQVRVVLLLAANSHENPLESLLFFLFLEYLDFLCYNARKKSTLQPISM